MSIYRPEAFRPDGTVYVATINTPGYLSEGDPFYADNPAECWEYLAEERLHAEDSTADDGDYSDTLSELRRRLRVASMAPRATEAQGTVCGDTPGYDGDHDLGVAYTVEVTSDVRWDPESDTWVSVEP